MKCQVCKRPVASQINDGSRGWLRVAAPHPAKKGKGICDGSGRPDKKR